MKGAVDKISTEITNYVIDKLVQSKKLLGEGTDDVKKYIKNSLKRDRKLMKKITNYVLEGDKND
ncbi:MAG: hypothetical protein PHW96_04355 [Candidatus Nanoarchaeia archaeon]|nr:hypothetical protein [Candidatus Nanoarchaeia archaeon]